MDESKKLIILDIDGVLIYRTNNNYYANALYENSLFDKYLFVKENNIHIFTRKNINIFLNILFEKYDVAIYTSITNKNLKKIIDFIFIGDQKKMLKFIWARDKTYPDFTSTNNFDTIKKLDNIPGNYSENNIIICDDSLKKIRNIPIKNKIIIQKYSFYYDYSNKEYLIYLLDEIQLKFNNI